MRIVCKVKNKFAVKSVDLNEEEMQDLLLFILENLKDNKKIAEYITEYFPNATLSVDDIYNSFFWIDEE